MTSELVTCGVVGHGDDCLCDVVVTSPTPIGVGDAVRDMWMGEQLCEYRDYPSEDGWTDDAILGYLTEVTRLHDAWVENNGVCNYYSTSTLDGSALARDGKALKMVRTLVRNRLAEPSCPTIDVVLGEFGFTAEHFTSAVSGCKWTMDMQTLVEFERVLRDPEHRPTFSWLSQRFGLSDESTYSLCSYWNYKSPRGNRNKCSLERERFNTMLSSDMSIVDIVNAMKKEFGLNYTTGAVRRARYRLRKGGK